MSPAQQALYEEYIDLISFGGRREIAPGYAATLFERFSHMPLNEIRKLIEEHRPDAIRELAQWAREQARIAEAAAEKRQYPDLFGEYPRTDSGYGRVVCADEDPQYEKRGMPLYPLHDHEDSRLKGYQGVHVGNALDWLPVLMRDGYCDGDKAYIYHIDTSLAYPSRKPFYEIEDHHVMDKTDTPQSAIIISRREKIPPSMVRLVEVLDLADVEEAPSLHENRSPRRPTSVAAILFNSQGQALILRRGPTAPWMPGRWNLPGGSLDPGESWFEGAARETEEETQLVVQRAQYLVTLGDPVEGWAVAFFVANPRDWSGRLALNYESDAYAWVTPEEVEDYAFVPTVEEALRQAFAQAHPRVNAGPAAQDLVVAAQALQGQHLNCRLFVQMLLGVPRLEELPVVRTKQAGDVLQWGANPSRHWAIYLGDGEVLEVSEWGASPQVVTLASVMAEYGKPTIRRMGAG